MASLSSWKFLQYLHRSSKPQVYLHSSGTEYEAKKVVGIDQILETRSSLSSRQGQCSCRCLEPKSPMPLLAHSIRSQEFRRLNLSMVEHGSLASLVITSNLIDEIKKAQLEDKGMMKLRARINEDKLKCFKLDDQGILWFGK